MPAATRSRPTKPTDGADAVLAAVAAMRPEDRAIGERLHAVITAAAPELAPRTWYGMPAYALDGKVLLFFRGTEKFKERYLTVGFNDVAQLDDGALWPITYALTKLTKAVERQLTGLVTKAAGR